MVVVRKKRAETGAMVIRKEHLGLPVMEVLDSTYRLYIESNQ